MSSNWIGLAGDEVSGGCLTSLLVIGQLPVGHTEPSLLEVLLSDALPSLCSLVHFPKQKKQTNTHANIGMHAITHADSFIATPKPILYSTSSGHYNATAVCNLLAALSLQPSPLTPL